MHLDGTERPEQFFFVQFLREKKSFHWKMIPGKVSPGKAASSGSVPNNCLQIGSADGSVLS